MSQRHRTASMGHDCDRGLAGRGQSHEIRKEKAMTIEFGKVTTRTRGFTPGTEMDSPTKPVQIAVWDQA
jgi:hypothetical protein